jgi:hypothetical protein
MLEMTPSRSFWNVSRLQILQFVCHDLADLKKLGTIQALILVLFYLHVMQLYHLHELFNYQSLIIGFKYVLG